MRPPCCTESTFCRFSLDSSASGIGKCNRRAYLMSSRKFYWKIAIEKLQNATMKKRVATSRIYFYLVAFLNHYPCSFKTTPEALVTRMQKKQQSWILHCTSISWCFYWLQDWKLQRSQNFIEGRQWLRLAGFPEIRVVWKVVRCKCDQVSADFAQTDIQAARQSYDDYLIWFISKNLLLHSRALYNFCVGHISFAV